jgi:nitrogen PTS system EIIA component
MKVLDYLDVDVIHLDVKNNVKSDVIQELCDMLVEKQKITEAGPIVAALLEREKLGSTGIGQGVAIPHGKSNAVSDVVAALGISKKGVSFESLDGEPVYIIFVLISPPEHAATHLKILARISRLLKDKFFRQSIREAKTVEEVKKIIQEEDEFA